MKGYRRSHTLVLAVFEAVLVLLALAGCSGGSTASTPSGTGQAQQPQAATQAPPAQPAAEPLHVSKYKPTGQEVAVLKTPKGTIKFKFYPADAPNSVASFIELAKSGFYNGTTFHRVEPGFVIQGGDPQSKTLQPGDPKLGSGGPGWRLKAEFNKQKHLTGSVALARTTDPDSAGSQFYICLAPQPSLDGQYTVIGQVTEGLAVIQKIQVGDKMESLAIVGGR